MNDVKVTCNGRIRRNDTFSDFQNIRVELKNDSNGDLCGYVLIGDDIIYHLIDCKITAETICEEHRSL